MKPAFLACGALLVVSKATAQVVPAGQDTYIISLPTAQIPVIAAPPPIRGGPDLRAADTKATKLANDHCRRANKRVDVKDKTFDLGEGYKLTFSCVAPK